MVAKYTDREGGKLYGYWVANYTDMELANYTDMEGGQQ